MDHIPLGVMLGSFVLGVSGYLLVKDFMLSNVVTARVKEDYVTFYRGVCYMKLYVAIGRYGAHISFENGRTPIDV